MSKSLISRRPCFRRGPAVSSEKTAQSTLRRLGWKPFFQQQLTLEELGDSEPVRVMVVHRSQLDVSGEGGDESLPLGLLPHEIQHPTVGDWLLLDRDSRRPLRMLERSSLFRRMAPGAARPQLIAANIDNVLIVSSCNRDFNLSRIERYLALVREAGCRPCLVLTKVDRCENVSVYADALREHRDLPLVLVNALDSESTAPLRDWVPLVRRWRCWVHPVWASPHC